MAAHQVEGNNTHNDWWYLEQKGLTEKSGEACDYYHRFKEDHCLIEDLNNNAFRFSIEWSRIEPEEGSWNEKEIEHYRALIQDLKKRNLEVFIGLHHFTTPLWLYKKGGMAVQKAPFYFARFAEKVAKEYGGLVDFWITINEPLIYAHILGKEPFHQNLLKRLLVIFRLIKAHKLAYIKIKETLGIKTKVGLVKNNIYFEPTRKFFLDKALVRVVDYFFNKWFLNQIKNYLDFIGLNYYFHNLVSFPFRKTYKIERDTYQATSDMGWEIYPEGIYHVLKGLKRYKKPIYVTENGLADAFDKKRIKFIKDHLRFVHQAIQEGVDVRGYFHWSLMDNFEWRNGFGPRFGLYEVDYATQERKPRPSSYVYAKICHDNGV